jgi:hypothetical protein
MMQVITPCLDFTTTCYDTMAHAVALRTSDLTRSSFTQT